MYWEIKILQLFPKGQGSNVFLKSSQAPTKSAGNRIEAGEGLGISGPKFTFFALEFVQKCAEVRSQQFELASQHKCLSLLKEAVSRPFWKGSCTVLTCLDMTSASYVTCCSAEVAETQTRALPWVAAPWGALGKSLGRLLPAAIWTKLMTQCQAVITYDLLLAGRVKLVILNCSHGWSKYLFSFPH